MINVEQGSIEVVAVALQHDTPGVRVFQVDLRSKNAEVILDPNGVVVVLPGPRTNYHREGQPPTRIFADTWRHPHIMAQVQGYLLKIVVMARNDNPKLVWPKQER